MAEPAFECVGFTPKKKGLLINCGNCKNYDGTTCLVRDELDELYEESPKYRAYDMMMRTNRGVNFSK